MTCAGNRDGLAAHLDGIEYPMRRDDRWKGALESAKVWGCVIIAGASDDILCFYGAFSDELSAWNGTTAKIDASGPLPERDDVEDDDELERFFARKKTAAAIKAEWCPAGDDVSWAITTDIPHSKFNVMEDGEVFCRAIVIDVRDLPATRSSSKEA